ncbi:growth/differentiation factor 10 [Aplochiton taeniatus]
MAALAMFSSPLFVLMLNCYLSAIAGRILGRSLRSAEDSELLFPSEQFSDGVGQDIVSQHMLKLYEKYNRENRFREDNTVRSFKARQDWAGQRPAYHLNLTSLQESEVIRSATLHFLLDRRPRQRAWFCKRFKNPSCRSHPLHPLPPVSLLLYSLPVGEAEVKPGSQGGLLGNMTFHPHRRGVWQTKDVTQVIREARGEGHLLLTLELDFGQQYQRQPEEALSAEAMPYVLLFANDKALGEPNSVAASLQRYDPFAEKGEPSSPSHSSQSSPLPSEANSSPGTEGRVRREAGSVHTNELPEVDYTPGGYRKEQLWESTYMALKPHSQAGSKEKKRRVQEGVDVDQDQGKDGGRHDRGESRVSQPGGSSSDLLSSAERPAEKVEDVRSTLPEGRDGPGDQRREGGKHEGRARGAKAPSLSPLLSFDERTMRKARRRQWGDSQHRGCSRRSMRVDFADIGWSEWVLAPASFDAYYCSGTCGFPMPKVMHPSNHATIQSIVRAVGIIPGVPEPCCVPERMSPLAVLFQDESRNLVLKVYPNMSVQSCSCR